jgi:hypothetical protein
MKKLGDYLNGSHVVETLVQQEDCVIHQQVQEAQEQRRYLIQTIPISSVVYPDPKSDPKLFAGSGPPCPE